MLPCMKTSGDAHVPPLHPNDQVAPQGPRGSGTASHVLLCRRHRSAQLIAQVARWATPAQRPASVASRLWPAVIHWSCRESNASFYQAKCVLTAVSFRLVRL